MHKNVLTQNKRWLGMCGTPNSLINFVYVTNPYLKTYFPSKENN